ncbi:MAG: ATP-binding protein, partial [Balneolaceae bacterium]
YLAAANMNLDAMKDEVPSISKKKQAQFAKGLNLLKHAINETSSISHNLMPRVVEDYGLVLALEALIDNYKNNSDTVISFFQNVNSIKLDKELEFNLYRIAQEGISNAVKYAKPNNISVQLIVDTLDLILTIDDNGVGFDYESPNFSPGLGLQTIKTRVGALNGYFEVESTPGKGTFLNVIIPLNRN